MRSSPTSGSRFRSSSLVVGLGALALALAACPGGGDDAPPDAQACGPGDAPAAGVVASGDQVTLTFGNLTSGLNNDCPAADAPEGVVSVTIAGTQTDGDGLFTVCIERPDLLAAPQALGPDVLGSPIHVVDVVGASNGCTFRYDDALQATGTLTATGVCDLGANPAGYAIALDGTLELERTCGEAVDTVTVTLTGEAAVTAL